MTDILNMLQKIDELLDRMDKRIDSMDKKLDRIETNQLAICQDITIIKENTSEMIKEIKEFRLEMKSDFYN